MAKKKRKYHRRTVEEQIAGLEARIEELRAKARGAGKFTPEAVAAERDRLGLSAREYGELMGVSPMTVYGWEKGGTRPQETQLEKWLAIRAIGKREAHEALGIDSARRTGFSPDAVSAERERLELSAADYGELVGVSPLTIYNWEKGATMPQRAQLKKWKAVRGIGKREAWRRLGYL